MINFHVVKGPTANGLLKRANKEAAYEMSPSDEATEDYERFITKDPFLQTTVKYRDDEDYSPRKELHPSSSFIEGVEYVPSLGLALITIGGKKYSFPGFTSEQMGDFITSDSLGRYLWSNDRWLTKHRK